MSTLLIRPLAVEGESGRVSAQHAVTRYVLVTALRGRQCNSSSNNNKLELLVNIK